MVASTGPIGERSFKGVPLFHPYFTTKPVLRYAIECHAAKFVDGHCRWTGKSWRSISRPCQAPSQLVLLGIEPVGEITKSSSRMPNFKLCVCFFGQELLMQMQEMLHLPRTTSPTSKLSPQSKASKALHYRLHCDSYLLELAWTQISCLGKEKCHGDKKNHRLFQSTFEASQLAIVPISYWRGIFCKACPKLFRSNGQRSRSWSEYGTPLICT